jgi:NAD(P)H-flavin reductase/ferredoxin
MTFTITVGHSDISFAASVDETILDAAERAGFSLPYSCRKGVCTTCEAPLRQGRVSLGGRQLEGPQPGVLLCLAKPRSDITILPRRIEHRAPAVRKIITARVFRLSHPAPDVTALLLRFPVSIRSKFRAGQYLRVLLPDGDSRNFSMANAPAESDGAQLHIRHVTGGKFSEEILAHLQQGDELEIEIPYGDFFLRESRKKIILIATGTGFAPLKSIVEDMIRRGEQRPCRLYWGGRTSTDIYMQELPAKWAARHAWFSFEPVLSDGGRSWTGRRGVVHEAVLQDRQDLSGYQVYACGNPAMVRRARTDFPNLCKLDPDDFFSDAFVPTGSREAMSELQGIGPER